MYVISTSIPPSPVQIYPGTKPVFCYYEHCYNFFVAVNTRQWCLIAVFCHRRRCPSKILVFSNGRNQLRGQRRAALFHVGGRLYFSIYIKFVFLRGYYYSYSLTISFLFFYNYQSLFKKIENYKHPKINCEKCLKKNWNLYLVQNYKRNIIIWHIFRTNYYVLLCKRKNNTFVFISHSLRTYK